MNAVGLVCKARGFAEAAVGVRIMKMCYTVRHGEGKAHTLRRGGLRAVHRIKLVK